MSYSIDVNVLLYASVRSGKRILDLEGFELPEVPIVRVQRAHAMLEEDCGDVCATFYSQGLRR